MFSETEMLVRFFVEQINGSLRGVSEQTEDNADNTLMIE